MSREPQGKRIRANREPELQSPLERLLRESAPAVRPPDDLFRKVRSILIARLADLEPYHKSSRFDLNGRETW